MKSPLISVIICTTLNKDRLDYLKQAIKSILNQTYKNFEIILVHNGKNPKIKIPYENKIKYFYTKIPNLYNAKNVGVKKAKGDYIAFLDDDDIWEKNKLELQIKENADIIFTDSKLFNEKGIFCNSYFKEMKYFGKISNLFHYILLEDPFFPSTWLIKRHILLKHESDKKFFNGGDAELLFRLLKEDYKVKIINKPLTKIRKHELNISGNKNWERKFFCYIGMYKKTLKIADSKKSKKIIMKKLSSFYFDTAYSYFIRGQLNNSRKYCFKSFLSRPNYFAFKRFFMTFLPIPYLKSINKIRVYKRNIHLTRYYMYRRIKKFFDKERKGKVLCVSGTGYIASLFHPESKIVEANYPEIDVQKLPYPDKSFDFVMSDQVIEHVEKPFQAINEMYRVLKKDGWIILTTCLMNYVHEYPVDYWRFTPDGLKVLCKKFKKIYQCEGWGNGEAINLIVNKDQQYKEIKPGTKLEKIASKNDNKNLFMVWIIAQK